MGPKINPTLVNQDANVSRAKETLKSAGPEAVEKAMKNMMGDLQKAGPLIMAHLKTCYDALFAMGAVFNSRNEYTEGKTLPAQVEDPRKFLESHFLARDTSPIPENKLMDRLLSNLGDAVQRGWLTNKQAEALKVFLGQYQPKVEETSQAQPMAANSGDSSSEREMQGQNQDQENQEYQAFYEEINGVEGGGASPSGSRLMNFTGSGGPSYGGAPSGGAPSGGAQRGGSRLMAFTGPGGGGGSGGGGTAPGGPGGGYAPPPPPPPSSGMGGGMGGSPYNSAFGGLPGMMQQENDYLSSNFGPGDPFHGVFQSLFESENWYRNFSGNAIMEIQKVRGVKEQILMELARINPNSVDGAKKMQILQARLGDAQMSERQYYDHISMAMKANNERKEYSKTIMDLVFQAGSAAIRNIGR